MKFASCDGCQLSLLDCEDELLSLARVVDIAHFPEATRRSVAGPWDLVLVEGSITTPDDAERIRAVRAQARTLVTIGSCATRGGIQALRNGMDTGHLVSLVYARPEYVQTLARSTAIADHVPVDFELHGCPIDKRQLLEVISATLAGRRPSIPRHVVCLECKARGTVCVTVARGIPCLGPVTHAGCGALCPTFGRGCFGCFGPLDGVADEDVARRIVRLTVDGREATPGIRGAHAFGAALFQPPVAGASDAGGEVEGHA